MLPAPGQGASASSAWRGARVAALLAPLADSATTICVRAERAVSRALGGAAPCRSPPTPNSIPVKSIESTGGAADGRRVIRCDLEETAPIRKVSASARRRQLRRQGAEKSLESEALAGYGILARASARAGGGLSRA